MLRHALRSLLLMACLLALAPAPAQARDSLGIYDSWGAFRDREVPRCYAIAIPAPSEQRRDYQPYASIGSWPVRALRNQLHLRLSRRVARNASITLILGPQRFALTGGGGDAWALDQRMDAAIIAAMRSAGTMIVSATDESGTRFSNSYDLSGAATAMDAASVGCARLGR